MCSVVAVDVTLIVFVWQQIQCEKTVDAQDRLDPDAEPQGFDTAAFGSDHEMVVQRTNFPASQPTVKGTAVAIL